MKQDVKIDTREAFKGIKDRLKGFPEMEQLIENIKKIEKTTQDSGQDGDEKKHFCLPYSSDPPSVEDIWK